MLTKPVVGLTDEPMYSIGAVARMLNVPTSTLRAWEERYEIVTPMRSEGSQRLYSRSQVDRLRFVKAQIDAGMSAADAHRLLAESIRAGVLSAGSAAAPDPNRPVVLVADRDHYAAELVEYFLRDEGFDVVTARDAEEAEIRLGERTPDIVILDVFISGGAGFRLMDDLAANNSTKVIAVAAIDTAEDAKRAGADRFMRKPLDPRALIATVRELVGARGPR